MVLADPILAQTATFMGGLDLGIDGIYKKQTISFETTAIVNDEYTQNLKKTLVEGFTKDGWEIREIIVKVLS